MKPAIPRASGHGADTGAALLRSLALHRRLITITLTHKHAAADGQVRWDDANQAPNAVCAPTRTDPLLSPSTGPCFPPGCPGGRLAPPAALLCSRSSSRPSVAAGHSRGSDPRRVGSGRRTPRGRTDRVRVTGASHKARASTPAPPPQGPPPPPQRPAPPRPGRGTAAPPAAVAAIRRGGLCSAATSGRRSSGTGTGTDPRAGSCRPQPAGSMAEVSPAAAPVPCLLRGRDGRCAAEYARQHHLCVTCSSTPLPVRAELPCERSSAGPCAEAGAVGLLLHRQQTPTF